MAIINSSATRYSGAGQIELWFNFALNIKYNENIEDTVTIEEPVVSCAYDDVDRLQSYVTKFFAKINSQAEIRRLSTKLYFICYIASLYNYNIAPQIIGFTSEKIYLLHDVNNVFEFFPEIYSAKILKTAVSYLDDVHKVVMLAIEAMEIYCQEKYGEYSGYQFYLEYKGFRSNHTIRHNRFACLFNQAVVEKCDRLDAQINISSCHVGCSP